MQGKRLEKLIPAYYPRVLSVFDGYIRDPLMHAVIEGRRPGRIYVDATQNPRSVVIWTETECLYVAGDPQDQDFVHAFRELVERKFIPVGKALDMDFLSIFSYPADLAAILDENFADLEPLRTPANTFKFNRRRFFDNRSALRDVPLGMHLESVDADTLFDPRNEGLLDSVLHYWGTVESFLEKSFGYVLVKDQQIISWLYVQAIGAGAQAPDSWTDPTFRGLGLASLVGARWIAECLARGQRPFWLNDRANRASRHLAERLGFRFSGDIDLVDIPFYPYEFYRGMARNFFLINDSYRSAALSFERAFRLQDADPSDYFLAAASWMHAEEPQRALENLRRAVDHGLEDLLALEGAEAFEELRGSLEWEALKQYYLHSRRKN